MSRLHFFRFLPLASLFVAALFGSAACGAGVSTVLSGDGPDSSTGGAGCSAAQECNDNPAISSLRGQCVSGRCVCNPDVAANANGKCGDPVGDGGTAPGDCVAKGGVCLVVEGAPGPAGRHLAGPGEGTCAGKESCWVPVASSSGPACTSDPGCNEDPSMSSLAGTCSLGICVCREGFYVQPSGRCGATPPPECVPQGGACRQSPATCNTDELASHPFTQMSCGDLIASVCCLKASSCKGAGREVPGGGWVPVDFTCCASSNSAAPICVNGWKTCLPNQTAISPPSTCK